MIIGLNSTKVAYTKIIRKNHAGNQKDESVAIISRKGHNWIVAQMQYDVVQFGIPKKFNTVEAHFFRGRTVAVWQFLDKNNRAYRSYYNISEPVSITGREVILKDLELDVIRDPDCLQIFDEKDFRKTSLTRTQLETVGHSLLLIIRGIVDA